MNLKITTPKSSKWDPTYIRLIKVSRGIRIFDIDQPGTRDMDVESMWRREFLLHMGHAVFYSPRNENSLPTIALQITKKNQNQPKNEKKQQHQGPRILTRSAFSTPGRTNNMLRAICLGFYITRMRLRHFTIGLPTLRGNNYCETREPWATFSFSLFFSLFFLYVSRKLKLQPIDPSKKVFLVGCFIFIILANYIFSGWP